MPAPQRPIALIGLSFAALLGGSCHTEADVDLDCPNEAIPADCDPLDPSLCALPFPSSHFLVKDDTATTGCRVAYADTTLPKNLDGVQTMPRFWNERDGYSINSGLLFYMADVDLDDPAVTSHLDIGRYADADAKVVVINAATGERHPIWVELDGTAEDPAQQVITIRPAKPFEWDTTYVVGIRGLHDHAGAVIASSPAFAALRDGGPSKDATVAARQRVFDDVVFPALDAQGFARADVQLAWDFHTASRENTLGRLEKARDDSFAWVQEQGGFDAAIDSVEEHDCAVEGEKVFRDLHGTFTVPLYLESAEPENYDDNELQAILTRDEHGQPVRNGTTVADFLVRIPCSVKEGLTAGGPFAAPVIQYGHGLLGSKDEAHTGWLKDFADERGFVIFAMDWTGFMEDDVLPITFMLSSLSQESLNPSDFAIVSERAVQGMIEQMLGTKLLKAGLGDLPELQVDGTRLIDPDRVWYYGISQGAIMGAALVSMSPDLQRGVFSVGGGPYSLLLPRSHDFDQFFLVLKNKYGDHRETMLFVIGLTQQLWDSTEGAGWLWDMERDAATPKQVLEQVAVYDNQVSTLGAAYQARAWDAVIPSNAVRPVWGLQSADLSGEGHEGPVLVEWKYSDLPDEPVEARPPATKGDDDVPAGFDDGRALDPHECVRREARGQEQIWTFLNTGKVVDTCGEGGCVGTVAGTCD